MILYLLFPALVLGVVGSQPANITEQEPGRAERNRTLYDNSTIQANNVTPSSYKEETQIEEELQSNQTSGVIMEDDESFQEEEEEVAGSLCQWDQLVQFSQHYCGEEFHKEMQTMSKEDLCILENVIRPYNEMTHCLEIVAHKVNCFFPNPEIQQFFLAIHSRYFQNCTKSEELLLEDAPQGLVIALTLIPVSFIPVLVYLVVWKS
ncbi:receptor activity-modifying protein 1-like isoform X2 [Brachyistius frenatus]